MSDVKERFNKILALALDPGAHEGEAASALAQLRKLVRANPSLTEPPPPPKAPPPPSPKPADEIVDIRVTGIAPFWLTIFVGNISEKAFELGMRSRLKFDYTQTPTALDVRCDGSPNTCAQFRTFMTWLIDYINSQPREPSLS